MPRARYFLLFALVIFQVVSAARIYGRLKFPKSMPAWYGDAHRLSGTLAFALTLPVVFHCLWSLGFKSHASQTRVFVHSLLGCFFYGAFATKMVIVRSKDMPSWALPLAGGAVFASLVAIWFTSSFWFFRHIGFPAF